jgi:hypothetical protein
MKCPPQAINSEKSNAKLACRAIILNTKLGRISRATVSIVTKQGSIALLTPFKTKAALA